MSKVLILSNMYPSDEYPTYGIFVKNQVEYLERHIVLDKVVIDNPKKGIRKYYIWFLKTINKLFNDRDIKLIHVHYIFPTGIPALLANFILKIPYVVTVHGGDYYKMAKKNKVFFYLTKLILNKASHIIVVGEDLKLTIESEMKIMSNISVLNMGVNTAIFSPTINMKFNEVKRILYVGNYLESKGLMDLVESLLILDKKSLNFKFELVGNIKNQKFYEDVVLKLKNGGICYEEHGSQSQYFVANMMRMCDVIVIPSHFEGFGLVALEAMACKLPIIASNVGGLKYLVSSRGVLFEPKSIDCLANKLEKYIINEQYNDVYIEKGYQVALSNSYEKINNSILNIYKEYLS